MARNFYSVLRSNTKRRAKRRGISYNLTSADWDAMIERANNHCELTGLAFDNTRHSKSKIRPLAASCDRIDSSLGYTKDNCRLTIFAANCAMSSWGEDFMYEWAKAFVEMYEQKYCGN